MYEALLATALKFNLRYKNISQQTPWISTLSLVYKLRKRHDFHVVSCAHLSQYGWTCAKTLNVGHNGWEKTRKLSTILSKLNFIIINKGFNLIYFFINFFKVYVCFLAKSIMIYPFLLYSKCIFHPQYVYINTSPNTESTQHRRDTTCFHTTLLVVVVIQFALWFMTNIMQ